MLSEKDTKQIYQILCHVCVCGVWVCYIALIALRDFRADKKASNYPPPSTPTLLISPAFFWNTVIVVCFCLVFLDIIINQFCLNNNATRNTHVQKCLQDKTNAILGQRTSLLLIFSHHAVLNIHPCVSAAFQQHWAGKYDTPTCLQLLGWAASSRCCWRPYTMHILSATFLLQNSQNRNRNDFCNCKNTHQSSLNSPNDKAGLQQSRASYRGVKCDRGVKYGLFFFRPQEVNWHVQCKSKIETVW